MKANEITAILDLVDKVGRCRTEAEADAVVTQYAYFRGTGHSSMDPMRVIPCSVFHTPVLMCTSLIDPLGYDAANTLRSLSA